MNLDEVVAANVQRLREEKRWSVSELARRLGVGRHLVYDMERPRPGAAQRQFLWRDIVNLCAALDTNLFELVLPVEGDEVEIVLWDYYFPKSSGPVRKVAVPDHQRDSRSAMGWRLFGLEGSKLSPAVLDELAERAESDRAQRTAVVMEAAAEAARTALQAWDKKVNR